jgi:hypothetical protein
MIYDGLHAFPHGVYKASICIVDLLLLSNRGQSQIARTLFREAIQQYFTLIDAFESCVISD